MTAPTLPPMPWDLIRAATADARALDRSLYVPYFGAWHNPILLDEDDDARERPACEVCTAGAVIARTLERRANVPYEPSDFDQGTAAKLAALNSFRQGHIVTAYQYLDRERPRRSVKLDIICDRLANSSAFTDWQQFKVNLDALDDLADELERLAGVNR